MNTTEWWLLRLYENKLETSYSLLASCRTTQTEGRLNLLLLDNGRMSAGWVRFMLHRCWPWQYRRCMRKLSLGMDKAEPVSEYNGINDDGQWRDTAMVEWKIIFDGNARGTFINIFHHLSARDWDERWDWTPCITALSNQVKINTIEIMIRLSPNPLRCLRYRSWVSWYLPSLRCYERQ